MKYLRYNKVPKEIGEVFYYYVLGFEDYFNKTYNWAEISSVTLEDVLFDEGKIEVKVNIQFYEKRKKLLVKFVRNKNNEKEIIERGTCFIHVFYTDLNFDVTEVE